MKLKKHAVSPVIASFILVVVAIIIALAVSDWVGPISTVNEADTEESYLYLGQMRNFGSRHQYLYGGLAPGGECGLIHVSRAAYNYVGLIRVFEGNVLYLGDRPFTVISVEFDKIVLVRR